LGDQAASPLAPFEFVSFFRWDPSAFITKTSLMRLESLRCPVRLLSKAIFLPLGDQTGHPLS
jgi:hypothetical protein